MTPCIHAPNNISGPSARKEAGPIHHKGWLLIDSEDVQATLTLTFNLTGLDLSSTNLSEPNRILQARAP